MLARWATRSWKHSPENGELKQILFFLYNYTASSVFVRATKGRPITTYNQYILSVMILPGSPSLSFVLLEIITSGHNSSKKNMQQLSLLCS